MPDAKYATLAELAQKATASCTAEWAGTHHETPDCVAFQDAAAPSTITALLAELAAAQAVVEAARVIDHHGMRGGQLYAGDFVNQRKALAAYDKTIRAPKGGSQP